MVQLIHGEEELVRPGVPDVDVVPGAAVDGQVLDPHVLADPVGVVHHDVPHVQIGVGEDGLGGALLPLGLAEKPAVGGARRFLGKVQQGELRGYGGIAAGELARHEQHGGVGPSRVFQKSAAVSVPGRQTEPVRFGGFRRDRRVARLGELRHEPALLRLGGAQHGAEIPLPGEPRQILPEQGHVSRVGRHVAGVEQENAGRVHPGARAGQGVGQHHGPVLPGGDLVEGAEPAAVPLGGKLVLLRHVRDALLDQGFRRACPLLRLGRIEEDEGTGGVFQKAVRPGIDQGQIFVREVQLQTVVQRLQLPGQNGSGPGTAAVRSVSLRRGVSDAADVLPDGLGQLQTDVVGKQELTDRGKDHPLRRVLGEPLGLRGEIGHAVDLVVEKLDADGLAGGGIDVHDAAPDGELAGGLAQLHPHVAGVGEAFCQHGGIHGLRSVHRHAQRAQGFGGKGDLQNGLGRGGDDRGAVLLRQDTGQGGQHAEPLPFGVMGGADIGKAVFPGGIARGPDAQGDKKIPGLRRPLVVRKDEQEGARRGGEIRGDGGREDLFRSVAETAHGKGLPSSENGGCHGGAEGGVIPVHPEEITEQGVMDHDTILSQKANYMGFDRCM